MLKIDKKQKETVNWRQKRQRQREADRIDRSLKDYPWRKV